MYPLEISLLYLREYRLHRTRKFNYCVSHWNIITTGKAVEAINVLKAQIAVNSESA